MERRALLAAILSLGIILGWYRFVVPRFIPPAPPAESITLESESASPIEPVTAPPPIPPPSAGAPALVAEDSSTPGIEGSDIVVETDLYLATFTTAGGRLKSFRLKLFPESTVPGSPPLEIIQQGVARDLPLGVDLRSAGGNWNDAGVLYLADRSDLRVDGKASGTLVLTGAFGASKIRKVIEVRGGEYLLEVRIQVEAPPSGVVEMAVGWSKDVHHQAPGAEVVFDTVNVLDTKEVHRAPVVTTSSLFGGFFGKLFGDPFVDIDAGVVVENGVQWVAYSGHYFLAALVPESTAEQSTVRAWLKRRTDRVEAQLLLPAGQFDSKIDLYIGPKIISVLENTGHSLRRAVDLGWFTFVAKPLLDVLQVSHRLTGNYGIDIILLTLVIKALFYPLTQRSMKSMQAMQRLQPLMNDLRERYKDKPDEMNRQIMELYRRHKVNPLGGCLPMLIQIPVFIGLYQALANAIELRHAPFFGWITDLSAPDRLGSFPIPFVSPPGVPVLTLLMGASMFVQQKMTPNTAAPEQQKVMQFMPVLFTFMFMGFPSGLTLYWLINNLMTILQQYLIMKSTTAGAES